MSRKPLENVILRDTIQLRKIHFEKRFFTIQSNIAIAIICALGYYFMNNGKEIRKINVLYVIIPPILYAIYAGIGYVQGWQFVEGANYPYFFLNWGSEAGAFGFTNELPFMGSAWWILVLLVFLIAVGYAYLALADVFSKRRKVNS